MSLTKLVLCGMMVSAMAGCATNGYAVRGLVGVDYHVNSTEQHEPVISAKISFESK